MNLTKGAIKSREDIIGILSEINDPEIPVVNIVELGIVRDVEIGNGLLEIFITPTYSGCPAMHMIKDEIIKKLNARGFPYVIIKTIYSPAWTTEWLSDETKEKLRQYGIAPPGKQDKVPFVPLTIAIEKINCPYCGSEKTELKSRFGSTACKSFYYCSSCLQIFEHFKSF
ncbi:MAG: 1,2-phenylacetyl-CoA epoxidase subunit PaaD [Bacillota bacterium]